MNDMAYEDINGNRLKYERCLVFRIKNVGDNVKRVCKELSENEYDFVHYYEGLFELYKVKKNKNTWNRTMQIVNSVYAPRYRYERACIQNGQEYELLMG